MNPPFVRGDRVRWDTTGSDGLPLTHYGFIGGRVDASGRVVVMLDGHLKGDTVVPAEQLQAVSVLTVAMHFDDETLLDDPSLRPGLVGLWAAEAERAGLVLEDLETLGTGVVDTAGAGFALAEFWAGGQPYVVRALPGSGGVCVRADLPRRWEFS